MELQRVRWLLGIALVAIGLTLWSAWQREHPPVAAPVIEKSASQKEGGIPTVLPSTIPSQTNDTSFAAPPPSTQKITVSTDVLDILIDPVGGDIVRAELLRYPQTLGSKEGVVLLAQNSARDYVAQTGLIGKDEQGPDSRREGRAHYTTAQTHYALKGESLAVDLTWQRGGIQATKTYVFHRGSYLVDVNYRIINRTQAPWQGDLYGQIRRVFSKEKDSAGGMLGVQMYQGAAWFTESKPFKKISFADMKKKTAHQEVEGGWAAMLERYFLCAWLPPQKEVSRYYTRVDNSDVFNIGSLSAVEVAPQSEKTIQGQLWMGPEIADQLKQIAPGLDLTVDYGILWPISQLLFWLLKNINHFVGNWGLSIILVTVLIKLLFYKLSEKSYRSMGQMRQLQPRIESLKQRYGDDKQQFSVAMMDLYRKEKINPLGGCLPILIQIPVFIALYYVLLESIELRQAPFFFWIKDLSSRDPYYVLPLIMGLTMFIQQKLNPAPPDPIQAKVMMLMPVIQIEARITHFPV